MSKPNGIIALPALVIAIAAVIILAVGAWWLVRGSGTDEQANTNVATVSNTNTQVTNANTNQASVVNTNVSSVPLTYDMNTVKGGEKVGGFTVQKVGTDTVGNFTIQFTGEVTITGLATYYPEESGTPSSNVVCFFVDENQRNLLPREKNVDPFTNVCFTNTTEAKAVLVPSGGQQRATVVLDKYYQTLAGDTPTARFVRAANTKVNLLSDTYTFDERKGRFYQTLDGKSKDVTTPFTLADYHGEITLYGALFWKEGATKTTTFAMTGDQKVPYENGVLPNFYWFSFADKKFTKVPVPQTWKTGDKLFDRVFAVHQSNSEERVMIEVGEYDITHKNFEPGFIGQEPVKTRGLLYIPSSNTFGTTDALTTYLSVLDLPTTQWHGFIWDSKNNIAAAVPGGEGCGAYSAITFVNLLQKTKERVGSPEGTTSGGYDYASDDCNPHNGYSPDEKWVYLYGTTTSGKTTFRLFSPATRTQVLRTVTVEKLQLNDNPVTWDLSGEYPKVTTEQGVVVDFN